MKLILYKLGFLIFIAYWAITLFFVFPKNPLNLSADKGKDFFQAHFFQTWSFFAPPPNYNERVYVVLTGKKDSAVDVIELLEPLLREKHRRAPFNSYHQAVDYVLNSSLIGMETNIRTMYNILNYEKKTSQAPITDSAAKELVISKVEKSSDFMTIANYARKVLLEKKIDPASVTYQIKIVRHYTPQFADRFSGKLPEEEVTFAGNILNF